MAIGIGVWFEASMSDRHEVTEATALLPFLEGRLTDWKRSKIKQRLRLGCVYVNGAPITRHDHARCATDRLRPLR